ncbi:MFS transporter [Penicillium sp. IBT 16267x]|nr:MFS transporter [Penicillium sp. IBT 16267x]
MSTMPIPDQSSTSPTNSIAAHAEQKPEEDPENQPVENVERQPEKFSVFTKTEKRAMVAVGSLAAFFSPLSSSIYFPALDTIATALDVSTSKINITVTTYLILQGAAPMFIAGFSDTAGRRPAYMICFLIYFAANLGLALQNSYAALLVLRMLQSAGSSGTVALANGLVADMVTSSERGSYIAFATIGAMLGPSISPIIGGLISQYLNWHWIFWFLLILGGVFFVFLALFLPETCRKVVGDGSVPPPFLNISLTDIIRQRRRVKKGISPDPQKVAEVRKDYRLSIPSPWPTLEVCFDLETMLILLTTGLMFACFYAVMTGATTSFHKVYHFNNIQTGLMYLPIGAGGILSAFSTGIIVDWNYRRHAKKAGLPVLKNVRQDLRNFNIERVRLEVALPMYYLSLVTVIAYGWVLGRRVNLAAPVILLFICGWALSGTSQVLSALMVDIWPGRSASATAANNLFRCELGAAASAAISPMTEAMGSGWAYTTLSLIALAASPCFWIMMKQGIKWRQKRLGKEENSEAKKSTMEAKA